MQSTVSLLDGLADFLLSDLDVGDPQALVEYDQLIFGVEKHIPSTLPGAQFDTKFGGVRLEKTGFENSTNSGCLQRKVHVMRLRVFSLHKRIIQVVCDINTCIIYYIHGQKS